LRGATRSTPGPNVYHNDVHVGAVGMHKSGKEWGYSRIPDREWKFGFTDKNSAMNALLASHDPKLAHESYTVQDESSDIQEAPIARGRKDPEIESMVKVVLSDLKSRAGDKKAVLDRLHNHWGPKEPNARGHECGRPSAPPRPTQAVGRYGTAGIRYR
jgi:hypothetical protein